MPDYNTHVGMSTNDRFVVLADDVVSIGFGFVGFEVSVFEAVEARAETLDALNCQSLTPEIGSDCQLLVI